MSEFFVELPDRGVTICAARAGSGPPLLVLNGTGSDLRNIPNALSWPLAKQSEILTFDHRCLGRTVQHDAGTQPSMADFAADALALCDNQGLSEFAVLGVSFGGMVAQELALLAGERIDRMVWACTSSGGAGGSSYPMHELPADPAKRDLSLWDTRYGTDDGVTAAMEATVGGADRQPPSPGLVQQLEARRHHETFDRLHQIATPTLIAYGRYDGVAPPSNSEAIAAQMPNAQLAGFDGGHFFMAQDRAVWPAFAEFLS